MPNIRQRMLRIRKPPVKFIPMYIIQNGHINLHKGGKNSPCELCGTEYISSTSPRCGKALNDAELHAYMDAREEVFALFLNGGWGISEGQAYKECGYTGFFYLSEGETGGFYIYQKDGEYTE